jgi:hypothetical protein
MKKTLIIATVFFILSCIYLCYNLKNENGIVFINFEHVVYVNNREKISLNKIDFGEEPLKWKWISNYDKILKKKGYNAYIKRVNVVYINLPYKININNIYFKQIYLLKITYI